MDTKLLPKVGSTIRVRCDGTNIEGKFLGISEKAGNSNAPLLSGKAIVHLMRKQKKTIRGIAKEHSLTIKRVREVRANGVEGFLANEWNYLITGKWLDQVTPA